MKCLIIDEVDNCIQGKLSKHMETVWIKDVPSEEDLLKHIPGYDILVMRVDPAITKRVIDAANQLKVIAVGAVGINHIDIDYAEKKGIKVFNAPGLNIDSVAELTIGRLIDISRQVVAANNYVKGEKLWNKYLFTGTELAKKTIGIIGYGKIGQRVGELARAFKMKVIAYDPYITVEQGLKMNTKMVTLDEIFKESNCITIHVPLTPETKNMISCKQIEMMKKGCIIVNMGRGGVVDEEAVLDALSKGKLGGMGTDVMTSELSGDSGKDDTIESPLFEYDNFIVTPHIGGQTIDSQKRIGDFLVENIKVIFNLF